jgi:hypothetical protein
VGLGDPRNGYSLRATHGANCGDIAGHSAVWIFIRGNVRLVLGMVLLGTGGCAALRNQSDAMCAEIAKFANSSTDASTHSVGLINDWGGPLSEEESQKQGDYTMYVKQCRHDDYSPGKDLCAYLMAHTSTEFPGNNVRRALLCLNDPASRRYTAPRTEFTTMTFSSRSALHVRSTVLVTVAYSEPEEMLTISAQKVGWRDKP